MDVRKPIIDNFSYQGKFVDCVNSSRNQQNLRQINVIQDILKQEEQKLPYQKWLDNSKKQKNLLQMIEQDNTVQQQSQETPVKREQEISKEIHINYNEMQNILPKVINPRRISSEDQYSLFSPKNNRFNHIQQNQSPNNSQISPQKIKNSVIISQNALLNKSVQLPHKQIKLKGIAQPPLSKSIKNKSQHDNPKFITLSTEQEVQSKYYVGLESSNKKKRRSIKRSVFHILSDSEDDEFQGIGGDTTELSDRGNFVKEEYATSTKVFGVENNTKQSDLMNDPSNNSHKKQKVFTEPDSLIPTRSRNNLNKSLQYDFHNQYIEDSHEQFEDTQGYKIYKKINHKFKPQNASRCDSESHYKQTGLFSKECLTSLNIPHLDIKNLSKETQNKSIYRTINDTQTTANSQYNGLEDYQYHTIQPGDCQNKAVIKYCSERKNRRLSNFQSQQQNNTDFYYGTPSSALSASKDTLPLKQQFHQSLNKISPLSSENKKSLYHFDFVSEDLSPSMQREKNSLKTIANIFNQSQQIQKAYKSSEKSISQIQSNYFDQLYKSIESLQDDNPTKNNLINKSINTCNIIKDSNRNNYGKKEINNNKWNDKIQNNLQYEICNDNEEEDDENNGDVYQKLLIHTGLTANVENINSFKKEIQKQSNQIHLEASQRKIQQLKREGSGIQRTNKLKKQFPLQKMPKAIQDNGKLQVVMESQKSNKH